MRPRRQTWGWVLFLVCAVIYTVAAWRDGDALLVVGGLAFLVACILFIAPGRTRSGEP